MICGSLVLAAFAIYRPEPQKRKNWRRNLSLKACFLCANSATFPFSLPLFTHFKEFRRRLRAAGGNVVNQWQGNPWRQQECWHLEQWGPAEFDRGLARVRGCLKTPFMWNITILKVN